MPIRIGSVAGAVGSGWGKRLPSISPRGIFRSFMSSLHRHLAAVWFADIAGYTSLSEENEGEAVRLAHAFQRAARTVADRFSGRIVKSMGDGALAEFSSTEMAVRSAYALHRAFAGAASEAGLRVGGLRVGVHVGDVAATDDGDLYGDGVNVASRI